MGEAKWKDEADACGVPRPRDNACPACRSRDIVIMSTGSFPANLGIVCEWATCRACQAVWEPFPEIYARDPVCAEPCDNCAFRPGSPEQRDKAKWKDLIDRLKPGGDCLADVFYCHKGVPIDMTKGPGNFLFPRRPVMMNGKAMRNPDGSVVTTEDVGRMRVCSGFLRMVWGQSDKRKTKVYG